MSLAFMINLLSVNFKVIILYLLYLMRICCTMCVLLFLL